MVWHNVFLFCVGNIFVIYLYAPSICSSIFASFPVQNCTGCPVVVKYGIPEWLHTEHGITNSEYGTRNG